MFRLLPGINVLAAVAAVAAADAVPPSFRLPGSVSPIRQEVSLRLAPAEPVSHGTVRIEVRVNEAVAVVWLNARGITVEDAAIERGGKAAPARIVDGGEHFIGLRPDTPLTPGPAVLRIRFRGKVELRDNQGLFLGEEEGVRYLFTQFEPMAARRAFPCFDEPAFKIPWRLTLEVPASMKAFANAPSVSETPADEGRKRVEFASSKPLPSYLVAFAVGPFDIVDLGRVGRRNTPVRLITLRGKQAESGWAAKTTPDILRALESYFGTPYPFEKLDQIAVPRFGGAMENPGLVTYASSLMLAPESTDTEDRRRTWVSVCAHELAHQWFGNLVTMAWWNDTWLNESFAMWMDDKIAGRLYPQWDRDESELIRAMAMEALPSTRRIRQPVESESGVGAAFDPITYSKGGAVLAMLESWLGPEKFRAGTQRYLARHAWRNARAEDFLASLSEAGGREAAAMAMSFVDQAGIPEVGVALDCSKAKPEVKLTQKQHATLAEATRSDEPPRLWNIPVCVEYPGGRDCVALSGPKGSLRLRAATGCPEWLLGNAGMAGYYYVRYEGDLLSRLREKRFDALSASSQARVLGDVSALTESGGVSPADAMQLAARTARSEKAGVIEAAGTLMIRVARPAMLTPESTAKLARFVQSVWGERARQLGWSHQPGDSEDRRLLRAKVVPLVAEFGDDPGLGRQARELTARWLEDRDAIPADMRGEILGAAMRTADGPLFDGVVSALKTEKNPAHRRNMVAALRRVTDRGKVRTLHELAISDEMDSRDVAPLMAAGARSASTRRMAFELLRDRYADVVRRTPSLLLGEAVTAVPFYASTLCSGAERKEAEEFFAPKLMETPVIRQNLAETLDRISMCAAGVESRAAGLAEFLGKY